MNSVGIIGLAKAIELSCINLEKENMRLTRLRDKLEEGLLSIEMTSSNGSSGLRLPNTCNISIPYVDGADLLRALSKDIAVSNGSACNTASKNPSHVLIAMGVDPALAFSSIRFSLGKDTTDKDVAKAIEIVRKEVNVLRKNNILWERRNLK